MAGKVGGNSRGSKLHVKKRQTGQRRKECSKGFRDELIIGLINRKELASLTRAMVALSVRAAYTLACIQFGPEMTKSYHGQKYVRGSLKKRICHYVVTTLFFANVLHKFVVTVDRCTENGRLDVEALMCMCVFMVQFIGWTMSLSPVFRWRESIQVLNTWDPLVAAISDEMEEEISPYEDVSSAVKVILGIGLIAGLVGAQAMVSILFSNLPVCIYPMCKAAGLLPEVNFMTPLMWQLVFVPAELLLGILAACNMYSGWNILVQSTGVQKVSMAAIK